MLGLALAGCGAVDDAFCANGNCGFSDEIQSRLSRLSGLPDAPPVDTSNKYVASAAAQQLGQQFFWDTRFSGTFNGLDSIKRPVPYGRVAKDCPIGGVCDCVTPNNCIPYGAWDGYAKLHANAYLRTSMWSDNPQDDSRAAYLDADRDSIPKGSWRTPSLRDVALTAPYMHDGSYATLEAVVDHYNNGADAMPNGTPNARIQPLFLTAQEESQLVEFLRTLTGEALPAALTSPPALP